MWIKPWTKVGLARFFVTKIVQYQVTATKNIHPLTINTMSKPQEIANCL